MDKEILILGAGKSSFSLIAYLAKICSQNGWNLTVGDFSEESARKMTQPFPSVKAISIDLRDSESSTKAISNAHVVISLLPANLHPTVAQICLDCRKHLITASYVGEEMSLFHDEAIKRNLLFLNECGLDPGIDHMSTMKVLGDIKGQGGQIKSFISFTGGLISPETDISNPWRYKFTWNSRNVVMAGQNMAKFLEGRKIKLVPYQQLFRRTFPIHIEGAGDYEGYANRDSLKYREAYGMFQVETMLRGTLRNKGFCPAWNILVQLGCCDDTCYLENVSKMSHRDFMELFLPQRSGTIIERVALLAGVDPKGREMEMLTWSGLFNDEPIGLSTATPAQALEHILNKKWKLSSEDKDMIVMWHQFIYTMDGKEKEIQATLVAKGTDSINTAMSKTVGLPMGIVTKLLLEGRISQRGVIIPVHKEIYDPLLNELKSLDIGLQEFHIR